MPWHLYPFCIELRINNGGSVGFSQELMVQFVLSAIHLLWTFWYSSCRAFGGKNKSELQRDSCYPPNNSVDALSCSLQCRRLGGRRGDRKENSTILYPFPLVLSTFPPFTLVFTLDIPPILLSLKNQRWRLQESWMIIHPKNMHVPKAT